MTNLIELTIQRPDDAATTRAQQALAQADAIEITTDVGYADAAEALKDIKSRWRELDETRKELKRPIDEAAARVQAFFKGPLDFLSKAEGIVKTKLTTYLAEQERQRVEAQRKADEAARRERERIQEQAREAERKAKEKADADRKAAEAAAAAGRAEEAAKLAARADSTEAKAAEKAEQLEQRAAMVVPPIIQREAPKVAGISRREGWLFEVTDESQVPLEYRPVDLSMIGKVVRALKGSTRIPGVRVYPDKTIAAGGK